MLEVGLPGSAQLSLGQQQAHFALWALLKSPLTIGSDLRCDPQLIVCDTLRLRLRLGTHGTAQRVSSPTALVSSQMLAASSTPISLGSPCSRALASLAPICGVAFGSGHALYSLVHMHFVVEAWLHMHSGAENQQAQSPCSRAPSPSALTCGTSPYALSGKQFTILLCMMSHQATACAKGLLCLKASRRQLISHSFAPPCLHGCESLG